MRDPADGAIKLLVIQRALELRRAHPDLFFQGSYLPLRATGPRHNNVITFARVRGRAAAIAVAGRFFLNLPPDPWASSTLAIRRELPLGAYRDVFTDRTFQIDTGVRKRGLPLREVFGTLPIALLHSI